MPEITASRKSEAKRLRIVEAAVVLFAKHGLERVTLRDIARQSGFLIGSIYNFFPEKERIYEEAVVLAFERCATRLVAAASCGETAEQRLREFVNVLFELFVGDSPYIRLIDREHLGSGSGQVGRLIRTAFWQAHRALNPLICELARGRNLDPGRVDWATSQVFSLVYGAAKLHAQHVEMLGLTKGGEAQFLDDLTAFALRALGGTKVQRGRP